ncbi:MAG: BMC domain-containing protein [Lachnospiraceae bacterium]|nr:BMC domain-containing protein [Lachnospiraceae bacterium]
MAIGFLECAGYGALLYAMDKACKATDITILGVDTINPKDTSAFIPLTAQVKFEGTISQVKIATEVAKAAALEINAEHEVITAIIERPYDGTDKLARISKVKFNNTRR